MDWLLENLEWIVGSIVALLGVVFGTSFIIKKNIQKSGKDSTNIQIKEFNAGLSYKDVKDLCLDLITDKLDSYKEEASVEAKKREEKIKK